MSTMKTNILSIIEELGGDLAVAYNLTVHQQTVKRWTKNYVPKKYWKRLAALAGDDSKKVYKQLQDVHNKLGR
jgi:transcription elongation factor GreA-like protein